ncbi:caspase family protein [Desulfobacter latus]|uniref:Caspase family protein n=1 Tax=Desulfobacter latus TaxID=2292 RepID=A0A850SXU4_9BACT|nr:caspase family protein [Desulfobacter latus]NWH05989.1 caspase family protein [Desulfobacter latus]
MKIIPWTGGRMLNTASRKTNWLMGVCIGLVLCLAIVFPAWAAHHALLIGVSEYPGLPPRSQLEGPVYDVAALKKLLVAELGFDPGNIVSLTDSQATKDRILSALDNLNKTTSPDDFVFIYFSGHGTSPQDKEFQKMNIDDMGTPYTGAVLPFDFSIKGSADQIMDRLIIGRRDIRPHIERLDKDRRIFGVFDACYSENAFRSLDMAKTRHVTIPWTDAKKNIGASLIDETPSDSKEKPVSASAPNPYKNTVFLSASSKGEPANDMSSKYIPQRYTTFDGNAHGALTNALLIGLSGTADLDGNGRITYRELHKSVRLKVAQDFSHTPRLLVPKDQHTMKDNTVFQAKRGGQVRPEPLSLGDQLKVAAMGKATRFTSAVTDLPGVKLGTENDFDLMIKSASAGAGNNSDTEKFELYLGNGGLLAELPASKVLERIKAQVRVKKLLEIQWPNSGSNVFLEILGKQGILFEGDSLGFSIETQSDAYILLINIDHAGNINVVYPYDTSETAIVKKGQGLHMPGVCRVTGEFLGTEYLKVFAFPTLPPEIPTLMGESFSPEDPLFNTLLTMLNQQKNGVTTTRMLKTERRQ